MKTIEQLEAEIIEDFGWFEDWTEKYEYIIDLGKHLSPYPEVFRDEAHLIKGCQSRVWLAAKCEDGKLHFWADSDAVITKGLIALLLKVLSGQSPQAVLDAKLAFTESIGIKEHLSPTRANGLTSMIETLKKYAALYSL